MKYNRLLLFALLLLSSDLFAQAIFLRSGDVQPQSNIRKGAIDSFNTTAKRTAGQAFAVIQFNHIPSTGERKVLAANGIELLDYLPQNTFTVSIKGNVSLNALQQGKAMSLFQLSPQQKMAEYFAKGLLPAWAVKVEGTVDVWIAFPKTLEAATLLEELSKYNVEILSKQYVAYHILSLRIAANRIAEIAALPFVEYIQPAPPKDQPLNYNSRTGSRATSLNASVANGGKGLNGEGVVIGIGDNADLQNHIDFSGRIINRNASPFAAHGVHVAGTASGAGNINELYRGFAPKATILSQAFNGVLDNAPTYVQDYGMVITNNSYGNIIDCDYHGTYDLYSRILDQQAFDLPNLLHVISAGNSGGDVCGPYPQGFHTVIGSYQTAKNVVTVGATNDSGAVAGFSSKGPVKDGRVKPEIVAMGSGVISAWPTNSYSINYGTSMSAPGVSGGLALLYQRYRQLSGGVNPKNGLMKAILCNGAMDRGTAGADFSYGFGWMNLLRSVETIDSTRYFSNNSINGATTTHTISIPANTAQVKIMLYWNDLPASIISTKNLVNDLDMEVVDPFSTTVLPQILDTSISALGTAATTGVDHVNNIEQVIINNPTAGSYTIKVKGTTVTNAQQEYFIVYDVVPTGIKLTAPAGGQGLVPGEDTKISWDAAGLTGTANLEFSGDGGTTWTSFPTAVDVNRIVYTWNVPNVTTSNALVRITDITTGKTSTSNPFTIIGQPSVSIAATQCEGYISLTWNAVAGATDYEVMILKDDEMKPIAVTTSTTYTISGLSKDSTYWVTVRARINGKPGRRAIAISRQPSNGTCTGTISDNDLKLEAILTPKTGRLFTSTQLTNAETVSVQIKNLDDAPVTGFAVSYAINGTWITENVGATIAANGTYIHTFSTPANLAATGSYIIQTAVTNNIADAVTANDTATVLVRQLDNQPLTLATPFMDNLETAVPAEYLKDTVGLSGIDRYDFSRTTPFGRARTFVNTGIANSGSKAITLDINRNDGTVNVNYLYGTFNLSNYTIAADLRLDFQYLNHGQFQNNNNRVWVRGSDIQPWIEAFKLDSAQADPGLYKKSTSIELSNLLAANGQNFTTSFGVRWGQAGQFQATDRENAAGYTFDDIQLYQLVNDVQMLRIDEPLVNNCSLTNTTQVKVMVRNPGSIAITNVPVSYSINGIVVANETIASIPANTNLPYTFITTADLSSFGAFLIQASVNYSGDAFKENDTTTVTVYNSPIISSFPYLQNFESGNGNFYAGGKKSSWEYGTPASRKISGAASGAYAWKTKLTGGYNDNELSYLYSPCFDVSSLSAPALSFSVALDLEDCGSNLCDGAWVEYSGDGITWTKLGASATGTNWYNKSSQQLWSVQNYTYWHVATQALPAGLSRLRLRFVLASDPGVNREGVAIDDIHIYDNTQGIYDGVTMAAPVTQTVSGNNWVDFTSGGKLIASIQPNNQSLGATDVQAYIYTGSVRTTNNQYYHNRNITIKPANNPATDSVRVRFYFLDSETEALLNATGCPGCTKPVSAYGLGVSKYTDNDKALENGSVADNAQGIWKFIASPQVIKVPFDKGYYAEYKVAGFSEFWLNNGGLNDLSPLPVRLLQFTAVKAGNDVAVQWTVAAETEVLQYEVEIARGNAALNTNSFVKTGQVMSLGNMASTRSYSFADTEAGKKGARYYRLKIVNKDGSFYYSGVRAVMFGDEVQYQLYPNPSTGVFSLIYQLNNNEVFSADVYDAKGSLVKEYRSVASGFLQKLNIDISANNYASGVYLLRISAGSQQQVFKLYKQ